MVSLIVLFFFLPLPTAQAMDTLHVTDTIANQTTNSHGSTVTDVDPTNTTGLFTTTVHGRDNHQTARIDPGFEESKKKRVGQFPCGQIITSRDAGAYPRRKRKAAN
jgi:hypothetical protein